MLLTISFDFDFIPLLVVLALAWLVPVSMTIFKIKKVPTIIVEILAGFIIGKLFLGSISFESARILDFLALSGFLFLMFHSGLEINVDQIMASFPKKKITYSRFLKNPLLVGIVFFFITMVLAYGSAIFLSYFVHINNIFYYSLILVTTSVGIIVPVLKNRGEINSRFGQMIILAAAFADISSIVLFSFSAFTIKNGFQVELLYILSLFIAFLIFYKLGRRLKQLPLAKRLLFELEHAASQITIRGAMVVIILFVALAQLIGEEVMLLGAFLGGLLLSFFLHKERSLILLKLDGMGYGFFIPIFFIMVGVNFDTASLHDFDNTLFLYLGSLFVILYAIKLVPAFLWVRLFGKRTALSGGFLMASRLSLIIAASQIGLDLGIISPSVNAGFIIMAVVTCTLSPLLYNYLTPRSKFKGDKTIIVGGSSTGVLLARRMQMHGKSAVIIEKDKNRYEDIKSKGITVIHGDGKDPSIFDSLDLSPSNYVVIETATKEENLEVARMLKKDLGHENVITAASTAAINDNLKRLNVELIDVTRTLATTIENLIIRPTTYHALVETFDKFNVEELAITNPDLDGLQVKEIPFHEDGFLMLIRRGNEMVVPHGDTYLKSGDVVVVFATDTAMDDFRKRFS
ncbi:MAG: cation:proton antiporter [Bacteroidales bacterium]|nr:cation:proton antiporter [Bacteroidales bacterium]